MQQRNVLIDFVLKEWLLVVSGVGVLLTSLYAGRFPTYTVQEIEVIFLLFALFVVVGGLRNSGLMAWLSRRVERGGFVPLKLVVATFFLSMLVTNDAALVVAVPLTLALDVSRKDLLVILQALAANAGSALTPFGNPQNLYIYWFYDVSVTQFMAAIAPFSLVFLGLLVVISLTLRTGRGDGGTPRDRTVDGTSYLYGALLCIVLLAVLHILPVWAVLVVVLYALVFDRRALRVDYALLFSFLFFFGLAENIRLLVESGIQHSDNIFLFSALASQLISNVPVTLLLAKFTAHWEAVLWGASTGGFGSLFGSFANLIAYKLYLNHPGASNPAAFTVKFLISG